MLKYMATGGRPNSDMYGWQQSSYYDEDEDDYCGYELWDKIYTFWDNFKSDKDFLYLVSCKWSGGDLDLEGGRSYILTQSNVITLIFDYLYNTLKYNKEKYDDIIWNSTNFSDSIQDMYNSIPVIRDTKINTILDTDG